MATPDPTNVNAVAGGLPVVNSSTPWPPLSHEMVYRDMEVYNAWYSGDIDALETLYATTRLIRRSGLWGQAKRFFFGSPVPGQQAQRPIKLHLPIPSEISRMSAQLMFGEMPKIILDDAPSGEVSNSSGNSGAGDEENLPASKFKKANARLNELLDDNVHAAFLECGELASALGGGYLRVTWDITLDPDKPFITNVAQDAAVPEFRFGRMAAVTFWSDLPSIEGDPSTYRLLERHEPGTIEWGLYQAHTTKQLGMRVPLGDHPNAASLAGIVDGDSKVQTGSKLLTAVYIPNVKPTRMLRKDPVGTNYGRSDYEGVDDLFDAFDEVWTSWMRDIRLAKSRIFVSKELIDTSVPGMGASFDADREVYVPVNGLPSTLAAKAGAGANSSYVQAEQFKIRYQEHQETARDLLSQIYIAAGFSPQTFGVESQHAGRTITATQVQFQERLTNLARGSKLLYAKPKIQRIVAALLDVDQANFGGPGRQDAMPDVTFPDTAAPALDALAQSLQLIRAAEAASTQTLVQMLNPDWSLQQVLQEVNRIHAEAAAGPTLPGMPSIHGAPEEGLTQDEQQQQQSGDPVPGGPVGRPGERVGQPSSDREGVDSALSGQ